MRSLANWCTSTSSVSDSRILKKIFETSENDPDKTEDDTTDGRYCTTATLYFHCSNYDSKYGSSPELAHTLIRGTISLLNDYLDVQEQTVQQQQQFEHNFGFSLDDALLDIEFYNFIFSIVAGCLLSVYRRTTDSHVNTTIRLCYRVITFGCAHEGTINS